MEVQYVNHGIGNRFGDIIELNENLKKYPNLHRAILSHEIKHTNKEFSKEDLMLDLSESHVNKFELMSFMIKHPKSLSQFLPVYYSKKWGLVYDINLILTYLVIGLLVSASIYFSVKFL